MALDKSDAKKNAKANAKAAKNASAPATKENGAAVPAKPADGECGVRCVQCDRVNVGGKMCGLSQKTRPAPAHTPSYTSIQSRRAMMCVT